MRRTFRSRRSLWFAAILSLTSSSFEAQPTKDTSDALFEELFVRNQLEETKLAEAFNVWTKLAAEGEAKSQFYLSYLYFGGLGPADVDVGKALGLVRAAADQEHAQAQYKLGNAYEFGQGFERNYENAIRWYERAAKQGYWLATERLASAYSNGELGLRRDLSKAEFWRSQRL